MPSSLLSKPHPKSQPRNASDEKVLFLRWKQDRDRDAHEALVRQYTPLCRSLARRYGRSTEPFEDLLQVAQLGLLKALERFDPERGFPFQAFAVPTILGEMRRYFRDSGWAVHVPRGVQERALEVRDAQQHLSEDCGHAPTVAQLCQYLELDAQQVLEGLQALAGYGTLSLDAPRHGEDEDGGSYAESIGDDDARYELVELGLSVASALKQLSPEQRELLRLRFVEDLTQTQIAQRVGISQMQVSRLLRRCLEKLRAISEASEASELEQTSEDRELAAR